MSKYTTEVRFICESAAGLTESGGFGNVNSIIAKSWDKIFTTTATVFDEDYKSVICSKILKHYYMREIGAETTGLWKLWMNTRLEEILPYYNQLYKSAELEYNPFYDVNITETAKTTGNSTTEKSDKSETASTEHVDSDGVKNSSDETSTETDDTRTITDKTDSTTSGSRDTNTNVDGKKTDAYSDTPQGSLSNIESLTYLTNARIVNDSTNTDSTETVNNETNTTGSNTNVGNTKTAETVTGSGKWSESNKKTAHGSKTGTETGTATSTEDYIKTIVGKQGGASYAGLLKEYRETLLNIDMLVIEEFEDLFMQLW